MGNKRWRKAVYEAVERLAAALLPYYVVLGGGTRAMSASSLPAPARAQ